MYWHAYTSLEGKDIGYDNTDFKFKIGYIIQDTIDGNPISPDYAADLWCVSLSCPVDMTVTDPNGLTISKDLNQIPGATYVETDADADGDSIDHVIIPHAKEGDYQITVIPEAGAMPTDTYTLTASRGDSTIVLTEDSLVADIPDAPYILTITLPGESSNTTAIIVASVSAFVVIAGLAFFLVRKRRTRQTSQVVEQ